MIATPAHTVPDLIHDCVEAEIAGAIIISAGFHESGKAGAELESRVLAEARKGRLRIIGPNSLGVMVPHNGLNASFAAGLARPGGVAFLSQSGALCTAVLDWSLRECIGFSGFVSVGAMADVGWGDLITWFGDDPHTTSIVCYMESVGDARSFLSAAREVALTKPIIVLKVGRTAAAAQAAASHTGSLTGSDAVLDAAFRRVGVLRVTTISELFQMAELLAKQPRTHGPRLSIVTNAGGVGALATDALLASGGKLAHLSTPTIDALDRLLPDYWSHSNPVDILGDADPLRYTNAVELVARDPETDGTLVILTPQAMTHPGATAERVCTLAKEFDKPVLCSWMGGNAVEAAKAVLNTAGIPTFEYPDEAAQAFSMMWRYSDTLRALYETPVLPRSIANLPVPSKVETLIAKARATRRTLLTEVESKEILAAYQIPTVPTYAAQSESEAVRLARKLGFPVAIKLLSETITHKREVGGVKLNVNSPNAVRHAWRSIRESVENIRGPEHFGGVTVQPMISIEGFELIIGSSTDPQFGPVILFGAGGRLVEVLADRALALPPLSTTLACRLMEETKIYEALAKPHRSGKIDLPALEELLVRFSQLIAKHRWIAASDINPLIISPKTMVALDARFILHSAEVAEDQLPQLAIRPYPAHYVTTAKLRDGTSVTIRPIRPDDEPLLIKFHGALSAEAVYQRYFAPMKLSERISHQRLSRLCFVDYDREMVMVVERSAEPREILAVGQLVKFHQTNAAEFSLLVADKWQNQGLGTQLLSLLVRIGREEKLKSIAGTILRCNRVMQQVARQLGFTLRKAPESGELYAERLL